MLLFCRSANESNRRSAGLPVEFKFVDVIKEVCKIEQAKQFVQVRNQANPCKWLWEKVNPFVSIPMSLNAIITVTGSGFPAVDGEYVFSHRALQWTFYTKPAIYQNRSVEFSLYRTSMDKGGFKWYISCLHDRNNVGTRDVDFYFADTFMKNVSFNDPSKAKWQAVSDIYGRAPVMVLSEAPPQARAEVVNIVNNHNNVDSDNEAVGGDYDDDDEEDYRYNNNNTN